MPQGFRFIIAILTLFVLGFLCLKGGRYEKAAMKLVNAIYYERLNILRVNSVYNSVFERLYRFRAVPKVFYLKFPF